MNTAKPMLRHGFTQFELTSFLLNNLSQFKLTPIAKLVLLELSACYNPNKPDMFPKQKTLAAKIGVSEASIIRAVAELHREGLIISERKYTNRYKFTSRILSEQTEEKNFCPEDMQAENSKNESRELAKCNLHDIEQRKEKITQQRDFKILKEYALKRGAKNINAYIAALKKNGSAEEIIKEYHVIQHRTMKRLQETAELKKSYEDIKATGVPPTQTWRDLKTKWGI